MSAATSDLSTSSSAAVSSVTTGPNSDSLVKAAVEATISGVMREVCNLLLTCGAGDPSVAAWSGTRSTGFGGEEELVRCPDAIKRAAS